MIGKGRPHMGIQGADLQARPTTISPPGAIPAATREPLGSAERRSPMSMSKTINCSAAGRQVTVPGIDRTAQEMDPPQAAASSGIPPGSVRPLDFLQTTQATWVAGRAPAVRGDNILASSLCLKTAHRSGGLQGACGTDTMDPTKAYHRMPLGMMTMPSRQQQMPGSPCRPHLPF